MPNARNTDRFQGFFLRSLLLQSAILFIAAAQIEKPPDFEQPVLSVPAPAGPDGSSHVSARGESISKEILERLSSFEQAARGAERKLFQQGYNLLRQRMAAAAVDSFRLALKQHPDSEPLLCGLAVALYLAGDYEESARLLAAHARQYPKHLVILPLLGELAGVSKTNRNSIEQSLRAFVRNFPSSGAARYYLARHLAGDQPQVPQEAFNLWTDAVRLDRLDPRPCLELARVEAARDQPAAAIHWLQCAVAREPSSAETHYRLARLYSQTGQKELADMHLRQFQTLRRPLGASVGEQR